MNKQNQENVAAEAILTVQELSEVSGGHKKHKPKHKNNKKNNKKAGAYRRQYAPMTCGGW